MKAVVLVVGERTRLRPLAENKPKGMVEVNEKPILTHCYEELADLGVDEPVVVVGYHKENIIEHYGDEFEDIPITYDTPAGPEGTCTRAIDCRGAHGGPLHVDARDNIFQANLEDVVRRQQEERADAAFLVEEVEWEELNRYGVCDTNKHGELTDVVEKPSDPPSNLVMTGFYTFSPATFHACHLVQPPNRGEYEISKVISLLSRSWRTIDAIGLEGWRIDIGFPEDRGEAEERLAIEKSDSMGDLQSEVES